MRELPLGSPRLASLWAVMVVGLAVFLAFGAVRIGAGFQFGRRMAILEIWSGFVAFLAGKGFTPALITGITLLLVASLVLAAIYLWFAFTLTDADPEIPPDDTVGS